MSPAPGAAVRQVTEDAVKAALRRALVVEQNRAAGGRPPSAARVLAVAAAPVWDGPDTIEIATDGEDPVRARVAPADSVLAVLRELERPQKEGDADYVVVLTPRERAEFGDALLGRFLGEDIARINNWDLVADEVGAKRVDPRLYSSRWIWLADSLNDVRRTHGLRFGSGVIRLDEALGTVAAVRFGRRPDERLDAAGLLEWTRHPEAVQAFTLLGEDERVELRRHLEEEIGAVARCVFRLLDSGQALESLPIGLALAELAGEDASGGKGGKGGRAKGAEDAWVRAEERFFRASKPNTRDLRAYGQACTGALLRLLGAHEDDAATDLIRRTEGILESLGAEEAAKASRVLESGLNARLAALGTAIDAALARGTSLKGVEDAYLHVRDHRRHDPADHRGRAAAAAVRLMRRLASGPLVPGSTEQWVAAHVHQTGWVDQAANVIRLAHAGVHAFDSALANLRERVRDWRADFDRGFAGRIVAWNNGASPTDALTRSENLQAAIAAPLARSTRRAPLIIVLDGMSWDVAVQIGAEISIGGRFAEIAQGDAEKAERTGALSTIPSVTTCSRTSLLSGRLVSGGQAVEESGFKELWASHEFGERKAVLFHQRDLEARPGMLLPAEVQKAIDETEVDGTEIAVGVVINTVDNALDKGREAHTSEWRVGDLGKLGALLDAAARAGRPVVITSDHGHVWDGGESVKTREGEAARFRTGEPEDGELEATGDRVLEGDGRLVVPYDERIRYTNRREGYHGGVSAAEMVIPVLVFVLVADGVPEGWTRLSPAGVEPVWWTQRAAADAAVDSAVDERPERKKARDGGGAKATTGAKRPPVQESALFAAEEVQEAGEARRETLGDKVVASARFQNSRRRVKSAPEPGEIAQIIDALAATGDTRPRLPAVDLVRGLKGKEKLGRPRALRILKMVTKVLNIEMYPVLTLPDGERSAELNLELLRRQFLDLDGGGRARR
ncbi:BREX-2 system phosphatase PglZ [Nocardiopsis suaedae]|uniref:BREX-2 system phosphatase PglZ n=1 Tax=Nocardiopsis suaedae TaxID=3018444 RepID=A0ABT4TPM1_9ACTN|nr:BREX-2 system phosphatase PglZ [Nocardiopsis suaedae]MDA2806624.1 BREX-2 system phosphatase PglZ [Nocardiopsis suaedae]